MELSKADLLQLLSHLEGELEARDIVIAALKCEKVKHMLSHGQYKKSSLADPISALHRDNFAAPLHSSDHSDVTLADYQLSTLENLVMQQRKAQMRMAKILKDAELRHRKVVQELINEKRKCEQDASQGVEITCGLEKERSLLKRDLETERQTKKRLEKDLKKISDVSDEDKNRQKQIVLLLLAERKKILMKYVEERKRSEDLAQILSEEKSRIDSMAEGLEEESKKSLQMEAELEKQLAQFDTESQILRVSLLREEKRNKELEVELEKAKNEAMVLQKHLADLQQTTLPQSSNSGLLPRPNSQVPTPPRGATPAWIDGAEPNIGQGGLQGNASVLSNVAKVVQPTATVSSVPVCGPTAGVAESISSTHGLHVVAFCPLIHSSPSIKAEKRVANNSFMDASARSNAPTQKSLPHVVGGGNGKPISRGIPPPVPPKKPIVPPKKDCVLIRRVDASACAASDSSKCSKETKQLPTDSLDQQIHLDNLDTYQNINTSSGIV
ncbi:hypothetical protein AAG570_012931 [Ranatra chinensis]|uniref:Cortactin-binding protein-2 N-terminal domain-containing protein n=1 Tax=Ranatra chinensis TaxID=642074 RepID=A0ABD0YXR4_9HEMI